MKVCKRIVLSLLVMVVLSCPGRVLAQNESNTSNNSSSSSGNRVLEVDNQPVRIEPQGKPVDRILAEVEDSAVTLREYIQQYGDSEVRRSRLQELIDQKLIQYAGKQVGILLEKSRIKSIVDTRLQRMKQSRGPRQFQRYLRQRELTEQQLRAQLIDRIRDQQLKAQVLVRFFPEITRPDTRGVHQKVKGRLMVVSDSETAWEIYRRLEDQPKMSTWDQLYEKHARKLGFVDEHGKLDWFNWGTYSSEIEYHLFKNDLFRLSSPFKVRDDYALVIPTEYKIESSSDTPPESRVQLYESYRRRWFLEQLSDRLRKRYSVEIPESVREYFRNNA